jgi:hypothetical protein
LDRFGDLRRSSADTLRVSIKLMPSWIPKRIQTYLESGKAEETFSPEAFHTRVAH